jgi:hypothetical protein
MDFIKMSLESYPKHSRNRKTKDYLTNVFFSTSHGILQMLLSYLNDYSRDAIMLCSHITYSKNHLIRYDFTLMNIKEFIHYKFKERIVYLQISNRLKKREMFLLKKSKNLKKIKIVDISKNIEDIIQSLAISNNKIESIEIAHVIMDEKSIDWLCYLLIKNINTLTSLKLENISLNNDYILSLCESLKQSNTLENLYIDCYLDINDDLSLSLNDLIKNNKKLIIEIEIGFDTKISNENYENYENNDLTCLYIYKWYHDQYGDKQHRYKERLEEYLKNNEEKDEDINDPCSFFDLAVCPYCNPHD